MLFDAPAKDGFQTQLLKTWVLTQTDIEKKKIHFKAIFWFTLSGPMSNWEISSNFIDPRDFCIYIFPGIFLITYLYVMVENWQQHSLAEQNDLENLLMIPSDSYANEELKEYSEEIKVEPQSQDQH